MFAVIKLGNQQFTVKAGDFIRVPFQKVDVQEKISVPVVAFREGDSFVFEDSSLKGSRVSALVLRQILSRKVLVFKKKRRKGYRKTRGHRQKTTELQILELCSPKGLVSKAKKPMLLSKTQSKVKIQIEEKKTSSLKKSLSDEGLAKKDVSVGEAVSTKSPLSTEKKL